MKTEDQLALLADKVDNLRCALNLSMPADFHVNQMKTELESLSKEIKEIYTAETGENPWEY